MSELDAMATEILAQHAGNYLAFRLTHQSCGIAVRQVREIMRRPPQKLRQIGLAGDSVEVAANIGAQDNEPAPGFEGNFETAGIRGVAQVKDAVKPLPNINQELAGNTLSALSPVLIA